MIDLPHKHEAFLQDQLPHGWRLALDLSRDLVRRSEFLPWSEPLLLILVLLLLGGAAAWGILESLSFAAIFTVIVLDAFFAIFFTEVGWG